MLPTFVIGLREGVEASLIVGIIAAFLYRHDARRQVVWVWVGVVAAALLCIGAAAVLQVLDQSLPQRQQEGFETVVALVAVGMVTWMIVWMSSHAHQLRGDLEHHAGAALAAGSAWGLVLMAFLAVLREGLETSVFLLSTFQASQDHAAAVVGAIAGIALAVALGYAIFRGGVGISLGRFFFLTSLVLVLVAGGLVSFAVHTAHEAGWLNVGQIQLVDLTWLVRPGTVQAALVTGVLGVQPKPTLVEVLGWLVYVVPVTLVVWRADAARRARRSITGREQARPPAAA